MIAQVIEALLFVSDEPVSLQRIMEVLHTVQPAYAPEESEIIAHIDALNQRYESSGSAFRIYEWAGGYRMATVESVAPYIKAYYTEHRKKRLSRSLLETLAIVAYKQPVSKPEVDFIRGVDSGYALGKLMELELITVEGRADAPGRPLLYITTARFLEFFGLKSLEDLPRPREIAELLDDPAFARERARLLALQSDESK